MIGIDTVRIKDDIKANGTAIRSDTLLLNQTILSLDSAIAAFPSDNSFRYLAVALLHGRYVQDISGIPADCAPHDCEQLIREIGLGYCRSLKPYMEWLRLDENSELAKKLGLFTAEH